MGYSESLMSRRDDGSGRDDGQSTGVRFPTIISVTCGLLAALLLVTATLPALAERGRIRHLEEARRQMLELVGQQNQQRRRSAVALERDPQALLVEIDRLGLIPDELLARQPAAPASVPDR